MRLRLLIFIAALGLLPARAHALGATSSSEPPTGASEKSSRSEAVFGGSGLGVSGLGGRGSGALDADARFAVSYPGARGPLSEALKGEAARVTFELGALLGLPLAGQVRIVLVENLEDMRRAAPEGAAVPAWAAGMAFSTERLVLLRLDTEDARAGRLGAVLRHELAHLMLNDAIGQGRAPRWFHEGFAIWASGEWSAERFTALARGVFGGRLFSLQNLGLGFQGPPADVELAYAQSIDFIGFLLKRGGPARFQRLLDLLRSGQQFTFALEEAYDAGLLALEADWQRDLARRFTWLPLITGTTVLWAAVGLLLLLAVRRRRRERALALSAMQEAEGDDLPPPPLSDKSP